jgi:hypothetical protein
MSDLPPLDQPQAYVVVGPDDQRGPYTLELLISEVVAGRLSEQSPVWWPGLADWTTMASHPGVAGEIQRRRTPTSPPSAPAPEQPAPGQHQQAEGWGYGQSGTGYGVQSSPGQDYSTEMYAGYGAPAEADVAPEPVQEPAAPVVPVDQPIGAATGAPVEAQESTTMAGETVAAEVAGGDEADTPMVAPAVEVPAADIGPEDFMAADEGSTGASAAGAAQGLDPGHGATFADLVARSRARADAAAIVAQLDDGFVAAAVSAAEGLGLTGTGREDDAGSHRLAFSVDDSTTLEVTLGRVTGRGLALRDGEVALGVTCRSTTYGGGAKGGSGEHGEIVVTSEEWGGASMAAVGLLLAIADYVDESHTLDRAALERDLTAAMSAVRACLS